MAHEVETMAYTNETPWHGLGKRVDGKQTVTQMVKAAGLDWRVNRKPIYLEGSKEPIDGFAALVRDKDNATFDIVGSMYVPTQNLQAMEFFNEFVTAGKATMETMGSLRGGRLVWGLANLKESFKLSGSDRVNGYLLCVNPHQQGKSRIFKLTSVRVVCANTMALSLRSGGTEHRQTHRGEFDEVKIERAKEALGIARDQFHEFEKTAIKLQKTKMKRELIIKSLMPIYQADGDLKEVLANFDKEASSKLKKVMDVLVHAPGAQPDNAWGVLNAVTYFSDHIASRSADKRLTNAWLGKTATQKEQALKILLEL